MKHPASSGPQVPHSGGELLVDLVGQEVFHLVLVGLPLDQDVCQSADHVEGAVLLCWWALRREEDLHQHLHDGIQDGLSLGAHCVEEGLGCGRWAVNQVVEIYI